MNKKYFLVCEALSGSALRQIALRKLIKKYGTSAIPEHEIGREISKLVRAHWRTMGKL